MKKSLFCLFSLTSVYSMSQITISSSDIPSAGTQYINVNDINLVGVDVGAAGADQTFDISNLMNTGEDTMSYMLTSETIYASTFSNSNLTSYNSGDSSYTFFNSTASSLNIEGMLMNVPIGTEKAEVIATNSLTQLNLPSTYLSTFNDLGEFGTSSIYFYQELTPDPFTYFDSIRAQVSISRTSTIDAWGTINTPFGVQVPVLRQTIQDITTYSPEFNTVMVDTVFGTPVTIPLGYQSIPGTEVTDTSYTYYFLANVLGSQPMIIAEIAQNNFGVTTSVKYAKLSSASVDEIKSNANLIVYPNPSENEITLKSNELISHVELISIEGKIISDFLIDSFEKRINLSAVNPGNYLLKIYSKSGVSVKHLNKL